MKLSKSTGETIWSSLDDAGGMSSVFSSPIITTIARQDHVLVQTRTVIGPSH